jgi:guanosine-3',5'-bis(diphosphate) 3'-pyrophosphohydrolase
MRLPLLAAALLLLWNNTLASAFCQYTTTTTTTNSRRCACVTKCYVTKTKRAMKTSETSVQEAEKERVLEQEKKIEKSKSKNNDKTRFSSLIQEQEKFPLLQKVEQYLLDPEDLEFLIKVYQFCDKERANQRRHDSDNKKKYSDVVSEHRWIHALGVAEIIAAMKLDVSCLSAALLWGTLSEDCCNLMDNDNTTSSLQMIQEEFGKEIYQLLQGLEKVDQIQSQYRKDASLKSSATVQQAIQLQQQQQASENYRKMMVTLAKDIRVILIKLAQQTQTLRMVDNTTSIEEGEHNNTQKRTKKKEIIMAQETLHLYAPLAHRLGIHSLKTELEDTSLKIWKPQLYQQLQTLLASRQAERHSYTKRVVRILRERLTSQADDDQPLLQDSISITGRPKSIFSIYHKMQSQNLRFDEIYDLMAFRILVDNVQQCYQALGIVHAHWKPLKGKFKDYIAVPKPNGYQSLHTTVLGPDDKRMEVQIRSHAMHQVAEGGVAAHWMYKTTNKKDGGGTSSGSASKVKAEAQRYRWLRQLVEWAKIPEKEEISSSRNGGDDDYDSKGKKLNKQQQTSSSTLNNSAVVVEGDDDEDEVFVFSPQGQLLALRKGSTILDYAYKIHSELGHHCVGGKVNGKMVKLNYALQNGDTVEILQSTNQTPKQEWLTIVQSSKAHQRIRSWLKKKQIGEDSLTLGRDILEHALAKKFNSATRQQRQQQSSTTASSTSTTDGMAEFKEKLDHVLSVFDLEDENSLYKALAYGQIRVKSVVNAVGSAPSRGDLDTAEQDELVLASMKEKAASSTATTTKPLKSDGVVIGGKRNILISFCRNCNPLYGEQVEGFVTQGRGVKIHTTQCHYLKESDPDRRVEAVWDDSSKAKPSRATVVEVLFEDSPGMLAAMSSAISSAGLNIAGLVLRTLSNGRGLARFEVMLASIEDLHRLQQHLQRVQGVLQVERR